MPAPPAVRPTTEKQLQQQVIDLASALGWRHYHTQWSPGSDRGWPDLTLVRERVVYAELKRENGKPIPEQQEWIDALLAAGQEAYVWRPSHFDSGYIQTILTRREPLPRAP